MEHSLRVTYLPTSVCYVKFESRGNASRIIAGRMLAGSSRTRQRLCCSRLKLSEKTTGSLLPDNRHHAVENTLDTTFSSRFFNSDHSRSTNRGLKASMFRKGLDYCKACFKEKKTYGMSTHAGHLLQLIHGRIAQIKDGKVNVFSPKTQC